MQIPYKQVYTTSTYNDGACYNEVAPLQYWKFQLLQELNLRPLK